MNVDLFRSKEQARLRLRAFTASIIVIDEAARAIRNQNLCYETRNARGNESIDQGPEHPVRIPALDYIKGSFVVLVLHSQG